MLSSGEIEGNETSCGLWQKTVELSHLSRHLPEWQNKSFSGLADIITFKSWKFQAVLQSLAFINVHLKESIKILLPMCLSILYILYKTLYMRQSKGSYHNSVSLLIWEGT